MSLDGRVRRSYLASLGRRRYDLSGSCRPESYASGVGLNGLFGEMVDRGIAAALERVDEEQLRTICERSEIDFTAAMREAVEQCGVDLATTLRNAGPEMLAERRQAHSAYAAMIAEHWGPAFDLTEMVLRVALEAGEDFYEQHATPNGTDKALVFSVLIRLHARACRIAEEVLVLMKNGYGQGAQARWRSLHEVVVVAAFIKKHGWDTANRYLLHEDIESWKAMQELQERAERLDVDRYTAEEMRAGRMRFDELCSRFGRSFAGQYGWAARALQNNAELKGVNGFAALELDVEFDHLRQYYRLASHPTHANPKGILLTSDQLPEVEGVLAGPGPAGLETPGQAVCISMTNVTGILLTSDSGAAAPFILAALSQLTSEAAEAFVNAAQALDEPGAET